MTPGSSEEVVQDLSEREARVDVALTQRQPSWPVKLLLGGVVMVLLQSLRTEVSQVF